MLKGNLMKIDIIRTWRIVESSVFPNLVGGLNISELERGDFSLSKLG